MLDGLELAEQLAVGDAGGSGFVACAVEQIVAGGNTQVSIKALKTVHTATHPARPITRADAYVPASDPGSLENIDALFDVLEREADDEATESSLPLAARPIIARG